jgi:hypothetical protein
MKRNPLKYCPTKNNEMICINIQTLCLYCIYIYINLNQKKVPFLDLFCRDRTPQIFIHNWKPLQHNRSMSFRKRKGKKPFQCSVLFFQKDIINHVKNKTNREKPAIGIEPMTIALQMRCSNL